MKKLYYVYSTKCRLMIKYFAYLIAVFILLHLISCSHRISGKPDQTNKLFLDIMSFNVRYGTANDGENRWENRRELVCDVLRNHQPDVAGLQEALRFQIDWIRNALPIYNEIGVARENGKEKGEYTAILYRADRLQVDESGTFWFSDTPQIPGSRHWGNACTRICTWARLIEKNSRQAFYIYNVHLDHQSQYSRQRSVQLLMERIRQRKFSDPFIVTGDFNAGENNPAILYCKGKQSLEDKTKKQSDSPIAMIDSFRALHPTEKPVGTFNNFTGRNDGEKIDYIFVQKNVLVQKAQIIRSTGKNNHYPSDHFPVTAHIRLSNK